MPGRSCRDGLGHYAPDVGDRKETCEIAVLHDQRAGPPLPLHLRERIEQRRAAPVREQGEPDRRGRRHKLAEEARPHRNPDRVSAEQRIERARFRHASTMPPTIAPRIVGDPVTEVRRSTEA